MKEVLIGIQARSTSTRLPDKACMPLGDKSVLSRICYQATRVCGWFSRDPNVRARVVILVPYGDRIKEEFSHKNTVIEGPEEDVLSRYRLAVGVYNPDYIVRLTGDCAWIPSRVISKHIRDALKHEADYCSNVVIRSFLEGYDCEVLSRKLFEYADDNHKDPSDREHVTAGIVRQIEEDTLSRDFKIHTVLNEYDLSRIKTSIDTKEEYEDAIDKWERFQKKKYLAATYGSVSN